MRQLDTESIRHGSQDSLTHDRELGIDFVIAFATQPLADKLPDASETRIASRAYWRQFWTTGYPVTADFWLRPP